MPGPLSDVTILEFQGLGPAPFAVMCLADMGARVIRITRPGAAGNAIIGRHREDFPLNLKDKADHALALDLARRADILVEGFRPGKMEGLGLGPDHCLAVNPGLVYGRMTGWGQTGPMAHLAGHDLNYLGLTGLLSLMGTPGQSPTPPLNLVSDYGGGGMYLALGLLGALLEARGFGKGKVVDAAMVHCTSHLGTLFHGLAAQGKWVPERGANFLDGGAPFYRVYETSDGRFMAVGAIEPQFWRNVLHVLDLPAAMLERQDDRTEWPRQSAELAALFATRSQADWVSKFEGVDACVTPVLTLAEASRHPQMRPFFHNVDGVQLPRPAPRFTR